MFTLEESAQLGFMLRAVGWIAAAIVAVAVGYAGVHWAHAHHHLPSLHMPHLVHHT